MKEFAGVAALRPKHHLWAHCTVRAAVHGCPEFYSTYADERLNQELAAVAEAAHPSTFSKSIFERLLAEA